MIRIEGIPIVTARLMSDAQKVEPAKGRKTTPRRREITKSGKAPNGAFRSSMQPKTKVA
jgi:hypothetical protein